MQKMQKMTINNDNVKKQEAEMPHSDKFMQNCP